MARRRRGIFMGYPGIKVEDRVELRDPDLKCSTGCGFSGLVIHAAGEYALFARSGTA
jgi:hypothetical protein